MNRRGTGLRASAGSAASRNARSIAAPRGCSAIAVWTTTSSSSSVGRKRAGSPRSPISAVAPRASSRLAFSESRASAVTRWPARTRASTTAEPM